MRRARDALIYYAPVIILALAWEAISRLGLVSRYALPPLSEVLYEGGRLFGTASYYYHAGMSVWRMAAGLMTAIVLGVGIGWLMACFRPVNLVIGPIVQLFYPMPKSALIPLTMLWFGLGNMSKIFLIFLGCLLPVLISTYNGVRGSDRVLHWSAASLGATRWAVMWDVRLMSAVPEILTGIRASLALAFVLLISSELVIASEGLGYLIRLLGEASLYPAMFMVIMTVAGCGFLADRAYLRFTDHALRWRQ